MLGRASCIAWKGCHQTPDFWAIMVTLSHRRILVFRFSAVLPSARRQPLQQRSALEHRQRVWATNIPTGAVPLRGKVSSLVNLLVTAVLLVCCLSRCVLLSTSTMSCAYIQAPTSTVHLDQQRNPNVPRLHTQAFHPRFLPPYWNTNKAKFSFASMASPHSGLTTSSLDAFSLACFLMRISKTVIDLADGRAKAKAWEGKYGDGVGVASIEPT